MDGIKLAGLRPESQPSFSPAGDDWRARKSPANFIRGSLARRPDWLRLIAPWQPGLMLRSGIARARQGTRGFETEAIRVAGVN